MRCNTVKKHLIAYSDGALSQGLHKKVSLHIASCGSCQKEYKALARLQAAMSSMEQLSPPPPAMAHHILQRARSEHVGTREREGWSLFRPVLPMWRPAFVAASLLCAIGIYWLYYSPKGLLVPDQEEMFIAERIDLFQNLDVIRDLSLLEMLESVENPHGEHG